MRLTLFAKIIFVIIALLMVFYAASYYQKKALTQSAQHFLSMLVEQNSSIASARFKNANTTVFSALEGKFTLTGLSITFKNYPDNPLNIGRVTVYAYSEKGFSLRLDDIFIKDLATLIKKPENYAPMLNVQLDYLSSQKTLVGDLVIFNQLMKLQTRHFRISGLNLAQPLSLNLKNNQWIQSLLQSKQIQYHIKNNAAQDKHAKDWIRQIEPQANFLKNAFMNSTLRATFE